MKLLEAQLLQQKRGYRPNPRTRRGVTAAHHGPTANHGRMEDGYDDRHGYPAIDVCLAPGEWY